MLRLLRHITLLLCSILLAQPALAQPYCRVRTFNVRDGLPSNNVSTIIQDKQGLIWTSTWNGLCYFDGYNFVSYRSSEENGWLSTNRILLIKHNSNNDIWLITYDRQLFLFDTSQSKFIDIGEVIRDKIGLDFHPRNIYPLSSGKTWITGHGDRSAIRISDSDPTNPDSMIVRSPRDKHGRGYLHKVEEDIHGREWLFFDDHIELAGTSINAPGHFEYLTSAGDATYVASQRGELYSYRPGASELNAIKPPTNASKINCLASLDDNSLLVGTDIGITLYDCRNGKSRTITTGQPGTPESNVTEIYVDSQKRIWAFTSADGIILADPREAKAHQLSTSAEIKSTTGSRNPLWLEDQFGTVWLVARGGVFGYYDEHADRIQPYSLQSPHFGFTDLPEIERFFIDKDNNLWLSSFHDLMLINFKRPVVKRMPLIKNQETRSLLARDDGSIWAGTSGGSIGVYDETGRFMHFLGIGKGGKLYTSKDPIAFSDKIYALYEDSRGLIWIGTKGNGLYLVHPDGTVEQYVRTSTPYSLSSNNIYGFDEDEKGNMWIATYGGGINLARFTETGLINFINPNNELTGYPMSRFANVRRVTHDLLGNIIVSCSDGLLVFSNKFENPKDINFFATTQQKGQKNDLRTGNVMQSLVTSSGAIIVTTMGGDMQAIETSDILQPQLNFISFGPESTTAVPALSEGNVLSLVEDNNGNICVTSDASMTIYSPSTGRLMSLGPNELGENLEFTEGQPVISHKTGRLLLPTVGGLISFSPQDLEQSAHKPEIIFTNVVYQGTNENVSILHDTTLDVPADRRDLSVEFAALDYGHDHGIQYAYKLEGVDDDWTYTGSSNVARLNHLSPGFQKLLVKSTNSDGVWTDEVHSLDIYVNPTFWETPVAKLIYAFIVILIIFIAFHVYELRRKNAMHQELDDMKNKFFADISHKLRTPLTLIAGPVNEVLHNQELTDENRKHLRTVLRNSDNMLELINKMLRWSQDNGVYISDENVVSVTTIDQVEKYPDNERYDVNPQAPEDSKSITLLIVEDNFELRNFLRDILSVNYKVEAAANGREGLEMAEKLQPDFIITDVMMPEMDGLTMVQHIKNNPSLSHIPIIVLSAKASLTDRVHGLQMGIDDYITKPFSASYLKQMIANIILQRRSLQQAYLGMIDSQMPQHSNVAEEPYTTELEDAELEPMADKDDIRQAHALINADEPMPLDHAQENNDLSAREKTSQTQYENTDNAPQTVNRQNDYKLESPRIADADQEMMTRLLKFLETRIDDENLKIEELAEAVNLGRTVFYGKIKSLVGVSPSDFLRHIRMQRATELIAKSKMNFSQIAFNVGFSDPKYFTKCFKKETGMTPSEYRTHARRQAVISPENQDM